ncbi:hypothetical protein [Fictibacillus fluitans]|uniref:Plasmid replication protein RepL domain-containing protein n=1 Tax=Fictibacillus fluitans TaxID=3058422 RepID=A0ABT8HQY8_9BACL|nr:hypothetical protein [Fictibacillus sp. NE201]MDN4523184.1 hypothetical protein [Fictibacillus sp. NE201]
MEDPNKYAIIDTETGELIKELRSGDKIISKERSEAFKKKLEAEKQTELIKRDKRRFSFGKMEKMKEVSKELDSKKCGYILRLLPYMERSTGYLKRKDGKLMKSKTDLGNALGVKKVSSRNSIIEALKTASVLAQDENGFKLNPNVHINGATNGKELIKLFNTTLEKLSKDLKPAELGYIYKLLPYVHYGTNLICSDPFEKNPEKLFFLNQASIGKLLGLEHKEVKAFITKLRKIGVIAEALSERDTRNRKYYVNPYIFYRKKGFPDDTLKSMFKSSRYNPFKKGGEKVTFYTEIGGEKVTL